MLGSSSPPRAGVPPEPPRLPDPAGAVRAPPEPARRSTPAPALRPPGTPVLAALTAWVQSLLWDDEDEAAAEVPADAPGLSADGGRPVPMHRPVSPDSGSQGEGGDGRGAAADTADAALRRALRSEPHEAAHPRAGGGQGPRADRVGLDCWRAPDEPQAGSPGLAAQAPPLLVTDPEAAAEVADLRGSRRRIEPIVPMDAVRRRRSLPRLVLRIVGWGLAGAVVAVLVGVIALALPSPDTPADGGPAPRHRHRQPH
jgi:hypothetical protein